MNSYHNTTNEFNLKEFEQEARSQERIILDFFREHKEMYFSPFEIHLNLFTEATPITSIRRAMSNLAKRKLLFKSNRKKEEVYGRNNYLWKYNL